MPNLIKKSWTVSKQAAAEAAYIIVIRSNAVDKLTIVDDE